MLRFVSFSSLLVALLLLLLVCSGNVATASTNLEPCSEEDIASLPFCNTSLPAIERAKDIVARLEAKEKIGQLVHAAPAIDRLHIPGYNWWTESLHGILTKCTKDGRCATSYPMPIGIGATFNMTLVKTMASQISSEGRRLFVEAAGGSRKKIDRHIVGLDFWAPNINIFRDPRWGRGMETPGEDPYLSGQYAIAYIKGMQEGEDSRYLKTISTLKHYAGYSLEKWSHYNRISFNAKITDEDMVQTYLPAFQAGIQSGRAKSVMCSYNAVNGVPSCANPFLLQTILREEWDWDDGYVVSDCGAISFVYRPHHYKPTPEETVAVSLKAGTDLNCGSYYGHLEDALQQGLITEGDLDKALVRLFTARIRLGLFDPWKDQPYMQYPPEIIGHPDHVAMALQVARESIVLLKNDNKALPLDASTVQKIAVLGPHMDSTSDLCGNYHGDLPSIDSPVQAIQKAVPSLTVTSMKGCDINSNSTKDFDAAASMAKDADVAILFMGISMKIEQEGRDRNTIDLPGVQEDFIKAIAKVQSKTVLVLINGGAMDVSAAKDNPNVVAIVEAFYPGMKGGAAIADVLFGRYNPSGRLPYTMHKKDFVDQISMADMSMTHYPGRTYRFFEGEAVYPFGYGLSYTTFSYAMKDVDSDQFGEGKQTYRVNVTNTGDRPGDVSVLAFVSFVGDSKDYGCPKSQLVGFQKVHLVPGETRTVFFASSHADLGCYHKVNRTLGSPHGIYRIQIDEERLEFGYFNEDHDGQSGIQ